MDFKTINVDRDWEICRRNREDAYVCSFGDAQQFHEDDGQGAERYREWLTEFVKEFPEGCVHGWRDGQIVAQIESHRLKKETHVGYVALYYLLPEFRGKGLSGELDRYLVTQFRQLGCTRMRLSVSRTNVRAMKYYAKYGWEELGARPDKPEVNFMEKSL